MDDTDDMYGIFCRAHSSNRERREVPLGEIEGKKGNPNRRLVEDYSYWFWNHR